ncbi:MAG TPA: hypothetical protein VLX91_09890 [Candidatus Acidoferrales bacterium]|nr:hypothetical protein [Candidatus Acidoferrales bacterium]
MIEDDKSNYVPWLGYKVGGTNREGRIIKFIVVDEPDIAIYFIERERSFVYEYIIPKFTNASEVIVTSKALLSRVTVSIPKRRQYLAQTLIATAFYVALKSGKSLKETNYFAEVEQFIESKSTESVHLKYVFAAIVFAALSIVPHSCTLNISAKR